jgi:hypothetical protein
VHADLGSFQAGADNHVRPFRKDGSAQDNVSKRWCPERAAEAVDGTRIALALEDLEC